MKKRWKIFWAVCLGSLAAGIILCGAAFAMGISWHAISEHFPDGIGYVYKHRDGFGKINYKEGEAKGSDRQADRASTFSNVKEIEVEAEANEVEIVADYVNEVTVETQGINKNTRLDVHEEEGTLQVEAEVKKGFFGNFRLRNFRNGKIIIKVPMTMSLGEVSVSQDQGILTMAGIKASEISMDMGAGRGKFSDVWANFLEIDCDAGEVSFQGHVENEVNLECSVGKIEAQLDGVEEDYERSIECGVGKVTVGEKEFTLLDGEKFIPGDKAKILFAKCDVGVVKVTFTGNR